MIQPKDKFVEEVEEYSSEESEEDEDFDEDAGEYFENDDEYHRILELLVNGGRV